MSESSSSSSSSGRVTKLTAAGRVPAWHFMDIQTEETQPRKKTTTMKILAAVTIFAAVGILATMKLYHHEGEVLPEVKNYVGQRMVDAKGFMSEFKDYIMSFFTANKKYMLEITPEGSNSFMDLKGKKIKKFNVNIK